jgi:hypothetical protein
MLLQAGFAKYQKCMAKYNLQMQFFNLDGFLQKKMEHIYFETCLILQEYYKNVTFSRAFITYLNKVCIFQRLQETLTQ